MCSMENLIPWKLKITNYSDGPFASLDEQEVNKLLVKLSVKNLNGDASNLGEQQDIPFKVSV